MKKTVVLILICFVLAIVFTGCASKSIVGKWIDVETEAVIEFTEDGYYTEGTSIDPFQAKTKYSVRGNEITRYVEGDKDATSFTVTYEIDKDGHLIINDILEYKPMDKKTEKD